MKPQFVEISQGKPLSLDRIPLLSEAEFENEILTSVAQGRLVSSLFGVPGAAAVELYAVLADDEGNHLSVGRRVVEGPGFASLTPRCPQVHLFEREIA